MWRIVSFILFVSITLYPQITPWEWQHPTPHGNHINDIVYFPSGKIVSFCNGGAISTTTNAGLSWNTMYVDSLYRDIYEADFVSDNIGYAAGTSGLLLKTTNGGATWQKIPGLTQTFWYLDFIDADTGYVVGSASALLKTTDGGQTWNSISLGVTTTLYRVFFLSPSTGYVGTSTAANRLYKTTDYGTTWVNITANVPFTGTSTIRGIFFSDENNGWVTTTLYEVYKTSNAGQSWVLQNDFGTGTLYDVKFVDSLKGITIGAAGQFFVTTDGGTTWTTKQADNETNLYGSAFKGNNAKSPLSWNDFVLCGTNGVSYVTSDAGTTLTPMFRNLSRQDIRKIQFLDANTGFASGGSAVTGGYAEVFKTINGGAEWTKVTLQTGYRAYSQCWTGPATGYFGTQGVNGIYKTTDGGNTITQLTVGGSGTSSIWYDIDFATPDLGFACGSGGNIMKTTDAGATWSVASTLFGTGAVYDIFTLNPTTVFVAGTTGRVIKSTDAGATWTLLTTGTTSTLYGVFFLDANTGFFSGASGRIHKTTDGGTTWTQLTSGVTATLYAVRFMTPQLGFVSGTSGTILMTADGGTTWTEMQTPFGTAITIYDLAVKDGRVWGAGTTATIIRASTSSSGITVLTPSSGISITAGASYSITWSSFGVTNVKIELSTDAGVSWSNIIQNQPAVPGTFLWNVPNTLSAQCKIRVTDAANSTIFGVSSGLFTISSEICRELQLAAGWNMVSIPVKSATMIPSVLFPTANSNAFGFNSGYYIADTFKLAAGYWLRFPASIAANICGAPSAVTTVPVMAGWNLIGLYHQNIQASNITSTPPGIVNSSYFEYANGYLPVTELKFGKGYWVRTSQAGALNLSTTVKSAAPEAAASANLLGTITVTDAAGKTRQLFVTRNSSNDGYALPPPPPAGIFDVRFADDLQAMSAAGGENTIFLRGTQFPITIFVSDIDCSIRTMTGMSAIIKSGSTLTIPDPSATQIGVSALNVPENFMLYQNFPNPFNPVTRITYGVGSKESGAENHELVSLKIFDVLGRQIAVLINDEQAPGIYEVQFDASSLPSGSYFYELRAGAFRSVRKMTLIK